MVHLFVKFPESLKMLPLSLLLVVMVVIARGQLIDDEMSQTSLPKPRFVGSVKNKTAPLGREAILECSVENLGNYKVTWIKMDTETLLTFHTTIIAGENRLRVSHNNEKQWFLHIKDVQVSDKGAYMCQINSQPMINQVGYLDVLIPPSIISDETPSEVQVKEGQNATLRCKASGYPTPSISWKREDGKEIPLPRERSSINDLAMGGNSSKKKHSVHQVTGEELQLVSVKREDSGAYLCIAKNGVTPTVSQRVKLVANFAPKVFVNRTDFGVMRGDPASLECSVEGSPRPQLDWIGASGLKLNLTHSFGKYASTFSSHWYTHRYELLVNNFTHEDYGQYRCRAENEFGSREATIRVFEKQRPTMRPRPTRPPTTTAAPTRRTTWRWFTTMETFAIPEGIETANEVPIERDTGRRKGTRTPPFYARSSDDSSRAASRYLIFVSVLYIFRQQTNV